MCSVTVRRLHHHFCTLFRRSGDAPGRVTLNWVEDQSAVARPMEAGGTPPGSRVRRWRAAMTVVPPTHEWCHFSFALPPLSRRRTPVTILRSLNKLGPVTDILVYLMFVHTICCSVSCRAVVADRIARQDDKSEGGGGGSNCGDIFPPLAASVWVDSPFRCRFR